MSLTTPTVSDISDNIIAQLQATLNQTIPLLPKSFIRVLAKTLAAVFVLLYKYAGNSFLQMFVETASNTETEVNGKLVTPLQLWGGLIGVGTPAPATQAELTIGITVVNQTGFLPANAQLVNSSTGVTYLTLASVVLDAATVSATVRAVSDQQGTGGAGEIGNMLVGQTMTFANPLANVAPEVVVTSAVITGAAGESTEAYRQRIIDRFQRRPQGGALSDYWMWGAAPSGIKAAYPYRSDLPGHVDVYVESATEADGIPTLAQLQEAFDAIEEDSTGLASRRPANALVNVLPITRVPFDVVINGLVVDDEGQAQADIEEAIEEYFLDREPYIDGLSTLPRKDRVTRSAVGGRIDDIVSAAGGIFTAVAVRRSGVTIDLYALGIGEKAKLGSITYS